MSLKLAYVVPTKDRPDDLATLFRSLVAQTVRPHQVVVVDGSDEPIDHVIEAFSATPVADLPVTYVRVRPPSLARQRNEGMAALDGAVDVAGYLDDDLELQPDATERMLAFWDAAADDVGGAAFSIINQPSQPPKFVDRFFLLNASQPGRVLRSSYAASIPFCPETIETQWLYGGATMWRREVIDAHRYDEWYAGHGYLEDLDYSSRVAKERRLFVVGDARVHHWSAVTRPDRLYVIGRQEIANRVYFARKHRANVPMLAWALLGRVALNLVAALRRRDRHHWARLRGNAAGAASVLRGERSAFGGNWK